MISRTSGSEFRSEMGKFSLVAVSAAVLASISLSLIGMAVGAEHLVYAGMAFLAFLMPATAGLMRGSKFDVFEPINMVAGALLFATTIRSLYLLSSDSARVEYLMWGSTFESVNNQLPWMLAGIAALVVGYVVMPFKLDLSRYGLVRNYAIGRRRLWLSIALSVAFGLIGLFLFVRQHGIDLSGNFLAQSSKRLVEFEGESGEVIYGMGYETVLGKFSQFGFLLLGSIILARMIKPTPKLMMLLFGLFFLSSLVPFFASSRTSILMMLIELCIIAYYYGRVRLNTILLVVALAAGIVAGMGYLRELNATGRVQSESLADKVLGAGNGIDFVRTSAIMDRVPEVRPFQNGRTYAALLSGFVPRAMWPDKPEVSLGTWVKGELFGQRVRKHGWPPGMLAEAYINFGYLGIIPVMLLFGAMLRFIYESCRPYLGVSLLVTMLYAVAIWRLGFAMIGASFAQGILQSLLNPIPMLLFLLIAKAPARPVNRLAQAPAFSAR